MTPLVERLGYPAGTMLLIVSCDELGFCHAANAATSQLLAERGASSAALMVPAPWARAAAADHRGEDVGVHLTINAELDRYRWGPITHAPSLLDGDGAFPRTIDDVWEHVDLDEVRREWRAQIERAVLWGFDVTHLVTHLAGVEMKPEFFDVFLDLAEDFHLPIRLPGHTEERRIGFPFRDLAAERAVLAPDRVLSVSALGGSPEAALATLKGIGPGVVEIVGRPAFDEPELRAATPHWHERVETFELLSAMAPWVHHGIELIGYRALARAMPGG